MPQLHSLPAPSTCVSTATPAAPSSHQSHAHNIPAVAASARTFDMRERQHVPQLQVLDREVDERGVLLGEEVVVGEAAHVQGEEGRQARDAEGAAAGLDVVGDDAAVVLGQDGKDGHLCAPTDDVQKSCLRALYNIQPQG